MAIKIKIKNNINQKIKQNLLFRILLKNLQKIKSKNKEKSFLIKKKLKTNRFVNQKMIIYQNFSNKNRKSNKKKKITKRNYHIIYKNLEEIYLM